MNQPKHHTGYTSRETIAEYLPSISSASFLTLVLCYGGGDGALVIVVFTLAFKGSFNVRFDFCDAAPCQIKDDHQCAKQREWIGQRQVSNCECG